MRAGHERGAFGLRPEEGNTGQDTDVVKVPLRQLLAHARPQAPALVVASLLSCVAAAVVLVQPLVVKKVFTDLSDSRPVTATVLVIVGMFLAEALLGSVHTAYCSTAWTPGRSTR